MFDEPSETESKAYKIELTEVKDYNNDGRIDMSDIEYLLKNNPNGVITRLNGDGDFRSPECIELLKECDVVVTNPPFSLFHEFIATMEEYGKSYAVICNNNAITYKEIFPLFKENKLWLGYSSNKTMEFEVPETYTFEKRNEYGRGIVKVPAISWFTNIPIQKRTEKLIPDLVCKYYGNEDKYPTYDNYSAINVDKVMDIPVVYYGVMGVPITFLGKYNPDEFEIVGQGREFPMSEKFVNDYYAGGGTGSYKAGNPLLGYYDSKEYMQRIQR